jgi:hypothetical protein
MAASSGGSDHGEPTTHASTAGEISSTSDALDGPGSTSGTATEESNGSTGDPPECHPLLAEVLYDALGANNGKQWVRLYNPCPVALELTGAYSLGWGGEDYTFGLLDLEGGIRPGGCWLVGGPDSNSDNANPVYDRFFDFAPDLQLGGAVADGVALFVGTAADVMDDTVPVDAVIYGVSNDSGLLDAQGIAPAPHVGLAMPGQSLRRTALAPEWEVAPSPTPNECPAL